MAEQIEEDSASWAEVQVTLIFTAGTSAIFLGIFEMARRNPSISSVFDRRRKSKPHRTPPPLLRNTIFEWLFLSNEPRYSEYSDLCHMRDVIKERRRQRNARRKSGNKDSSGNSKAADPDHSLQNNYPLDSTRTVGNVSVLNDPHGVELTSHPHRGYPMRKLKVQRYLTPDVVEVNGRRLPVEVAEYALANDLTEIQLNEYEDALVQQEIQDEMEFHRRVKAMKLRYESKGGGMLSNAPTDDNDEDDEENPQKPEVFHFDENKRLELPARPSRLFYINFQQGILTGRKSVTSSPRLNTLTPKSLFSRMWSTRNTSNRSPLATSSPVHSPGAHEVHEDVQINRHLKTKMTEKRPLVESDLELLRCIGLDTFVMIRFLRFCFDVTFYPFLLSLVLLIPTYYNNNYNGVQFEQDLIIETQTEGYFRYTMNRLESGSTKIWVPFGFTVCFVFFILRRHWIEWETFIALRLDFMANGDVENEERKEIGGNYSFKSRKLANPKDDVQLHLEQYRNSCIVEYIPESHRRDKELYQFFDAIFPGQVKRAEIVLNASYLAGLVKQRQMFIEKYESVYAKFQHKKQQYFYKKEGMLVDSPSLMYCLTCKCFKNSLKVPRDPTMSIGRRFYCCAGKKVKALPYLLSEIKRLNTAIEKEHRRISQSKVLAEDRDEDRDIITANLAGAKNFIIGTTEELTCDTGFVEFKNLTAKQSALQCNLTGTDGHMLTESAPDPRDMKWENAAVERKFIRIKKLQCDALLFTGTLFWAGVVSTITGFSDIQQLSETIPGFPDWLVPKTNSIAYVALEGYLPVVLLELLMLPVPILLKFIATRFIRFKTHSEIDYFVYKWHFAYRVANLIIIIVRHQVLKTFKQILKNPQAAIGFLTSSVASSSQFFLNNMLLAAGTETLFELSQIPRILSHFIIHRIITIEAASKRTVERLQSPISLEWGDVVPKFIFALLIAAVYSAIVPVVTGVCAVFFYISTKVYTHQALFIYAQPYEGGGKLMYQLNRSVFTIVYTTVNMFSVLLALKDQNATAVSFFVIMNGITFLVDRQVRKKFIKPGLTLALVNARIIDEQNKLDEERSRLFEEYRQAKLAKRIEAAKIAKKSHAQSYKDIAARLLPPLARKNSENEDFADSPPSIKRTRFHNMDVQHGRKSKSEKFSRDDFSDDESDEGSQDFYLYRQPELNKALWETKPRAYMD